MPIVIQHRIPVRRIGQRINQLLLVLADPDCPVEELVILALHDSMIYSGIVPVVVWDWAEEEKTDTRHLGIRRNHAYISKGYLQCCLEFGLIVYIIAVCVTQC